MKGAGEKLQKGQFLQIKGQSFCHPLHPLFRRPWELQSNFILISFMNRLIATASSNQIYVWTLLNVSLTGSIPSFLASHFSHVSVPTAKCTRPRVGNPLYRIQSRRASSINGKIGRTVYSFFHIDTFTLCYFYLETWERAKLFLLTAFYIVFWRLNPSGHLEIMHNLVKLVSFDGIH